MKYFYIPSSLDLEQLLQQHQIPTTDKRNRTVLPKFYFIIHSLFSKYMQLGEAEYFSLNAKLLMRIIGKYYRNYLDILLSLQIIETDNHYITANQATLEKPAKSIGFRLSKPYRITDFVTYENNSIGYQPFELSFATSSLSSKKNKINNNEYHYDLPSEELYILSMMEQLKLQDIQAIDELDSELEKGSITKDEYQKAKFQISSFLQKDFYYSRPTRARVYTSVSQMSKKIRRFLRFQNQELKDIDLCNAHPLFANHFLKGTDTEDGRRWYELTSKGALYGYLVSQLPDYDRQVIKEAVTTMLASSYCSKKMRPIVDKIKELFPTVWTKLDSLRKRGYSTAKLLQKMEADIFIDTISKQLIKEQIPFWNVHDGIITISKHSRVIESLITQTLNHKYQLQCKVKTVSL
jgi:hypothetical protein